MVGKGPSLFVQLNSLPKISRVSGKSAATAIPPIPGRKTGFPNWRLSIADCWIADCSDIVFLFWRCSRAAALFRGGNACRVLSLAMLFLQPTTASGGPPQKDREWEQAVAS